MQRQLFWYGYYERPVEMAIKKMLRPGSVFIDIGANIGYFSIMAARQCSSCTVVAFEPVKELFEEMKANILLNDIPNIIPLDYAAGDKEEERTIFLSGSENRGMSSLQKPENYMGKTQQVKVVSIDEWFSRSGLKKVDLIKIDVEGNEPAVLKGMESVIKKFRPVLIMEVNPETLLLFKWTVRDIDLLVREMGYESKLLTNKGAAKNVDLAGIRMQVNVLLTPP